MKRDPAQFMVNTETTIRPFDGSLADARGVLAVEQATFDESPYSPEEVCAMLTDGPQSAWVATGGGHVVGFVIAFPTKGLRGCWWEIDLLAVLPAWRGLRLATRLIRAAADRGAEMASWARAVVATDNGASVRAFGRAGFQAQPEVHSVLICRPQDAPLQPWPAPRLAVWEAASVAEAVPWLAGMSNGLETPIPGRYAFQGCPEPTILLAEQDGQPAGYAELIEVQTLLYRGVWLESLAAPNRAVRESLVREAVNRTRDAGLEEIGAVVPERNVSLHQTLLATGFHSLGDYRWLKNELPQSRATHPGDGLV
jgi:ribosomal protein S18 acetylase RimI-like enzyme